MKTLNLFTLLLAVLVLSCSSRKVSLNPNDSLIVNLSKVPDSIKIDNIIVHNLFKSQILAHKNGQYDSLLIVKNVYRAHQQLWDNCYAMIFGEENARKFNNPAGMVAWNKSFYLTNKTAFDKRASQLLSMNFDGVLNTNLKKFNKLVTYHPKATISILFTPLQGLIFGGCTSDQFALELNPLSNDLEDIINKGIPHELNHLAYEPNRVKDPNKSTALAQVIDEGFACYFTWEFFDRKLPKYSFVENMTEADWNWYIAHEKEIFKKVNIYFDDKTGNNPLLMNGKFKLFPDAPKTLFYWLGFRIIEAYVEKHGPKSWQNASS
jgi:hypothetical protein